MRTVLKTFTVYPSDRCGGIETLDAWAALIAVLVKGSPTRPPKEKEQEELKTLAEDVDNLITLHRNIIEQLRPNYLIQYAVMCKELAKKPKTEYECERQQLSFWATRKTLELNFDC